MGIELRESLPLSRFIWNREWTPLKGAYLYPLRFFAKERSYDPNDYLEVLEVIDVDDTDIAITRGGGLFARDHAHPSKRKAVSHLADVINLLLCEFALHGLASHPVTDTDIQDAKLIGKYASITGGWGSYGERTWGPFSLLAAGVRILRESESSRTSTQWPVNFYWTTYDPDIIDRARELRGALRIKAVAPTLPSLLVASVHHSSRHNISETIIAAWIVCELILSFFWDGHVGMISDRTRMKLLKDTRTYTAAVRAEVLLSAGSMDQDTYVLFQRARKARNDLAHRAVATEAAASNSIQAMRSMLRWLGVQADRLPGYTFQSGGIGAPARVVEPEFPFR